MRPNKIKTPFLTWSVFLLVILALFFITSPVKADVPAEASAASDAPVPVSTSGADAATQNPNQSDAAGSIKTLFENSSNGVLAPGEFLPISIKLVNFGSQKRIDVTIDYQILDSNNNPVVVQNETVAVETTASFVKRIQLPSTIKPGLYTAQTTLYYPYQEQPAVSKFSFSVENKIGGFFISDFIVYAIFFVIVMLAAIIVTYMFTNLKRKSGIMAFDYSSKPKHEMIYYEVLSNIISQMRLRIGDDAITIAQDVPDLKINPKTGYVENIEHDPAKIIALLIFRYEKLLGQKISFSLQNNKSKL